VQVNNFRLSIATKTISIELEGPEELVEKHWRQLKYEGLGEIGRNFSTTTAKTPAPNDTRPPAMGAKQLLNDLLVTGQLQTEIEWLLVYAHVITEQNASKSFSREQVLEMYRQTKRYTRNRSKSLTYNLKSATQKGWIRPLTRSEFVVTNLGKEYLETLAEKIVPNNK